MTTQKQVNWLEFPGKNAIARRMIASSGANGMIIRVAETPEGAEIKEKAVAAGFAVVRGTGRDIFMSFKDLNERYSVSKVAEMLGATKIKVDVDVFTSQLTIGGGAKKPAAPTAAAPASPEKPEAVAAPTQPAPAAPEAPVAAQETPKAPATETPAAEAPAEAPVQVDLFGQPVQGDKPKVARPAPTERPRPRFVDLGKLNHEIIFNGRSNLVIARDPEGNRYGGKDINMMEPEEPGTRHMRFLRATNVNDAERAAELIIRDALTSNRHWNREMLGEFVGVLTEGSDINRIEMLEAIRSSIIRGVVDLGLEDGASIKSLDTALRVCECLDPAISEESKGQLSPSLGVMVMMRRLMRGVNVSDISAHEDLRLGLQGAVSGPASSVIDLSTAEPSQFLAYMNGVLSRRDANGRTIVILPYEGESAELYDLREQLARAYGIEGTISMTSVVADGVAGARKWSAIFIGDRRPEILPMAPVAARRTFDAMNLADIRSFEVDVMRSRRKIMDFNNGVVEEANTAEAREATATQIPTVNMCGKASTTMIPYSLSGAVQTQQARVIKSMEPYGGVMAGIASRLGMSITEVDEKLSGEQIDAVATMMDARDRGRGFLLADEAGIGKTRPQAMMARLFQREGLTEGKRKKIVIFTEKGDANAPDVMDNLRMMGVDISRAGFLTANSLYEWEETMEDGTVVQHSKESIRANRRAEILQSGEFPEEYDILITTYSMFNNTPAAKVAEGKPVAASSFWAANAFDEDTMILFDEAHNAVKHNSNTGGNIRAMESRVLPENVIKFTATPIREAADVLFYENLLPPELQGKAEILETVRYGDEATLEVFTTMLVSDGVMMRRAHSTENCTINVIHPTPERLEANLRYHSLFSRVIRKLVEVGNNSQTVLNNIRQEIADADPDRWDTLDERNQAMAMEKGADSRAIGNPIDTINGLLDLAVKVDHVIDLTIEQLENGLRPQISFDETLGALLSEIVRDSEVMEDGSVNTIHLSMVDQVRRVVERTFVRNVLGEKIDLRERSNGMMRAFEEVEALITELPEDFAVSPVDRVHKRLREAGYMTAEVTGRKYRYDEDDRKIVPRSKEERDKAKSIADYQNGRAHVLLYNASGATGVNTHDNERTEEAGRGQRVTNVMRLFRDPLRFVQGANRANRAFQLTKPIFNIMMSGMPYGERQAQMLNRNLHVMASSVDGTREHPLLVQDVPDMLNRLGDRAVATVLRRNPDIASKLGYDYLLGGGNEVNEEDLDIDIGLGTKTGLASQAMLRFTALDEGEDRAILEECVNEYLIIKEEAALLNRDPTKPKRADGVFYFHTTAVYSGAVNTGTGELNSAFDEPVIIASGYQEVQVDKINGERLMAIIGRSRRVFGSDVAVRSADTIRAQMRDTLMTMMSDSAMRDGVTFEEAMANPELGGARFVEGHKRLNDMATFLSNIPLGAQVKMICPFEAKGGDALDYIITGVNISGHPLHASSYEIEYVHPGDWKPRKTLLSVLMRRNEGVADMVFEQGMSRGPDAEILQRFDENSHGVFRKEVQAIMGNMIIGQKIARQAKLGSPSLFTDDKGRTQRAIIIEKDFDLTMMPRQIASPDMFRHLMNTHLHMLAQHNNRSTNDFNAHLRIWGDSDTKVMPKMLEAEHKINVSPRGVTFDILPLGKGTWDFYNDRPGLYEALHGVDLPAKSTLKSAPPRRKGKEKDGLPLASKSAVTIPIDSSENYKRIVVAMTHLMSGREAPPFYVSGSAAPILNEFRETGIVKAYELAGLPDRSAVSVEKGLDFKLDEAILQRQAPIVVPDEQIPEAKDDEPYGHFSLDDDDEEEAVVTVEADESAVFEIDDLEI